MNLWKALLPLFCKKKKEGAVPPAPEPPAPPYDGEGWSLYWQYLGRHKIRQTPQP